jgi:hypothetical protein
MFNHLASLLRPFSRFAQARRFTTAPEAFYFQAIHSYFLPQAVFTAIDLGLADHLKGSMNVNDLAKASGTVADRTDRLMKYLAVHGVFERVSPGVYRHNAVSEVIKGDNVRGRYAGIELMRVVVSKAMESWTSTIKGEADSPFQKTFGNLTMWEFLALPANEPIKKVFDQAMVSLTNRRVEPIIAAYQWQRHPNANVIDVGGGFGHLLTVLLQKFPTFKGVVFDLPETATHAQDFWTQSHTSLLPRVRFETGSFLETIPSGGDIYLLKYILHDWKDEDCIRILNQVAAAVRKTQQSEPSKHPSILVIDQVYDFPPRMGSIADSDMTMFSLFAAKERSLEEFEKLFAVAGLKMVERLDTSTDLSILRCEVIS